MSLNRSDKSRLQNSPPAVWKLQKVWMLTFPLYQNKRVSSAVGRMRGEAVVLLNIFALHFKYILIHLSRWDNHFLFWQIEANNKLPLSLSYQIGFLFSWYFRRLFTTHHYMVKRTESRHCQDFKALGTRNKFSGGKNIRGATISNRQKSCWTTLSLTAPQRALYFIVCKCGYTLFALHGFD